MKLIKKAGSGLEFDVDGVIPSGSGGGANIQSVDCVATLNRRSNNNGEAIQYEGVITKIGDTEYPSTSPWHIANNILDMTYQIEAQPGMTMYGTIPGAILISNNGFDNIIWVAIQDAYPQTDDMINIGITLNTPIANAPETLELPITVRYFE